MKAAKMAIPGGSCLSSELSSAVMGTLFPTWASGYLLPMVTRVPI